MNSLVASVIRTYTPIIVGQLAAWLIMIHIPVRPELEVLLTALVGAILSASYYTLVRILEQQWPWFGAFLGLTASPDAYSKGNDTAVEAAKQTSLAATAVADVPAPTIVSTTLAPAAVESAPIDVKVTIPETAPVAEPAPSPAPAPAQAPVPTV